MSWVRAWVSGTVKPLTVPGTAKCWFWTSVLTKFSFNVFVRDWASLYNPWIELSSVMTLLPPSTVN